MTKLLIAYLMMLFMMGTLVSCGQSSGDSASSVQATDQSTDDDTDSYSAAPEGAEGKLTGTAAVGAPVPNGIIKVKCSDGQLPDETTDAFGKWTVDVQSCTAPYLIRVKGSVGGKKVDLLSAADSADVGAIVNVTPITHMIISNVISSADPEEFDNESFDFTKITKSKIQAQEEKVKTALSNVIKAATGKSDISDLDLMNTPFATDHSGIDAVLDVVKVEINTSTDVIAVKLADGSELFEDNATVADDNTSAVTIDSSKITKISNLVQTYSSVDKVLKDLIKYVQSNANAINQAASTEALPAGYSDIFHSDFLDSASDVRGALHGWFGLSDMSLYDEFIGDASVLFANANIQVDPSNASRGILFFDFILDGKVVDKGVSLSVAKEGSNWKLYGDQIPYEFHAALAAERKYRYNPDGDTATVTDTIKLEVGFKEGAEVGDVQKVKISNAEGDVIANVDMSFEDWNGDGEQNGDEPSTVTSGVMLDGAWNSVELDEGSQAYFIAGDVGEYILEFYDGSDLKVGESVKVLLPDPKLLDHAEIPALYVSSETTGTDVEVTSTGTMLKGFCTHDDTSYSVSLGESDLSLNFFYGSISGDDESQYEYEMEYEYEDQMPSSFPVDGSSEVTTTGSTYKNFQLYLRDTSEVEFALRLQCY